MLAGVFPVERGGIDRDRDAFAAHKTGERAGDLIVRDVNRGASVVDFVFGGKGQGSFRRRNGERGAAVPFGIAGALNLGVDSVLARVGIFRDRHGVGLAVDGVEDRITLLLAADGDRVRLRVVDEGRVVERDSHVAGEDRRLDNLRNRRIVVGIVDGVGDGHVLVLAGIRGVERTAGGQGDRLAVDQVAELVRIGMDRGVRIAVVDLVVGVSTGDRQLALVNFGREGLSRRFGRNDVVPRVRPFEREGDRQIVIAPGVFAGERRRAGRGDVVPVDRVKKNRAGNHGVGRAVVNFIFNARAEDIDGARRDVGLGRRRERLQVVV